MTARLNGGWTAACELNLSLGFSTLTAAFPLPLPHLAGIAVAPDTTAGY